MTLSKQTVGLRFREREWFSLSKKKLVRQRSRDQSRPMFALTRSRYRRWSARATPWLLTVPHFRSLLRGFFLAACSQLLPPPLHPLAFRRGICGRRPKEKEGGGGKACSSGQGFFIFSIHRENNNIPRNPFPSAVTPMSDWQHVLNSVLNLAKYASLRDVP